HTRFSRDWSSDVCSSDLLVPGKLGINVWGEYRYRDALQDAAMPGLTALDQQRAKTGHVGLSWTPDARQRIDLSASAGNEDQEGEIGRASCRERVEMAGGA